jgi:hypothetical protein
MGIPDAGDAHFVETAKLSRVPNHRAAAKNPSPSRNGGRPEGYLPEGAPG